MERMSEEGRWREREERMIGEEKGLKKMEEDRVFFI